MQRSVSHRISIFSFENVSKFLFPIRVLLSFLECLRLHEGRTKDESHTDPSRHTLTPLTRPPSRTSLLPPPPICLSSLSHSCPICPVPLSPLSHLSVIPLGFSLSSLAHNCTALVRQTHSFHQRAQEGIFLGRALTDKPPL